MAPQATLRTRESKKGASVAARLKLWLICTIGYWVVRLIGCTLRWEKVRMEALDSVWNSGKRVIYVFWHERIFLASWLWRDRGIVVMTSQHTDGEYMAGVIRRMGYGAARGSSTRGGRRALVEMGRYLRAGRDVAFTIDGPRGPRHLAKPGAIYLAWKSGFPVLPLIMSARRKWIAPTWDGFQVPLPFSRAYVQIGDPIYVRPDATEEEVAEAQCRLQQTLEGLTEIGDGRWSKRAAP